MNTAPLRGPALACPWQPSGVVLKVLLTCPARATWGHRRKAPQLGSAVQGVHFTS